MNIVISAGYDSNRVVESLKSKFDYEDVEFSSIEDINDIYKTYIDGKVYDRMIIFERAWTNNGEISDKYEKKNKINQFAINQMNRKEEICYVFIVNEYGSAEEIDEELNVLNDKYVIIIKQGIKAAFLNKLLVCPLESIPDDLKYIKIEEEEEVFYNENNINEEARISDKKGIIFDSILNDDYNSVYTESDGESDITIDIKDDEVDDVYEDDALYADEYDNDNEELEISDKELYDDVQQISIYDQIEDGHGSKKESKTDITDSRVRNDTKKDKVKKRRGKEKRAVVEYTDDRYNGIPVSGIIIATGCGGSGTSSFAYNIANTLVNLGKRVLVVDMDTENRAMSYITAGLYEEINRGGHDVRVDAAIKSLEIDRYIKSIKADLHVLGTSLHIDKFNLEEKITNEDALRFITYCKSMYDYIIIDINFNYLSEYFNNLILIADSVAMVTEFSNWGVNKLMLNLSNIDDDRIRNVSFRKIQLIFNRITDDVVFFNQRYRNDTWILKEINKRVCELTGDDGIDINFEELRIGGRIMYIKEMINSNGAGVQYTDTEEGLDIFREILINLMLKN